MRLDELFSRCVTEKTWTKVQGRKTVARGTSGLTDSKMNITNRLRPRNEEA